MLCFAHSVDDGRVTFREAATLRKNGYRVAVLGRSGITGRIGGHRVYGVPTLAFSNRYEGNMVLRFLLEPFSLLRFHFICRRYIGKADIVHCHEYQSLLVALILTRNGRQKIVYDCHEFQPELFAEMFANSSSLIYRIIRKLFARYEIMLTRRCAAVVTVNEFLAKRFSAHCPLVCNLPNYPLKKIFRAESADAIDPELSARLAGRNVLVFAGHLSANRGVVDLLYIMREITKTRRDVALLLVGGKGNEEYFVNLVNELDLNEQVIITGAFKYDTLAVYLKLADLGVYLPSVESWHISHACSTKVFQYCAAGLPVVLQDNAAHRSLMAQHDFAITVDSKDYAGSAHEISRLLDDTERLCNMGRIALQAFQKDWNAENVSRNLIQFYKSI